MSSPWSKRSAAVMILRGYWPQQRLWTTWVPSTHQLPPELAEAVDDAWVAALARPGVSLFDGALCRLEGYQLDSRGLHLRLSRTSYKAFLGTNGCHPHWAQRYGPAILANPLGTSVALRSGDGHLVFGVRGSTVALYPGHIHPFGGTMEPPEPGSQVDPVAEMARELHEELGVARAEVADLHAMALCEDRALCQPELVYAATTHLTRTELIARLDPP